MAEDQEDVTCLPDAGFEAEQQKAPPFDRFRRDATRIDLEYQAKTKALDDRQVDFDLLQRQTRNMDRTIAATPPKAADAQTAATSDTRDKFAEVTWEDRLASFWGVRHLIAFMAVDRRQIRVRRWRRLARSYVAGIYPEIVLLKRGIAEARGRLPIFEQKKSRADAGKDRVQRTEASLTSLDFSELLEAQRKRLDALERTAASLE